VLSVRSVLFFAAYEETEVLCYSEPPSWFWCTISAA
jgi:hypothetical protein